MVDTQVTGWKILIPLTLLLMSSGCMSNIDDNSKNSTNGIIDSLATENDVKTISLDERFSVKSGGYSEEYETWFNVSLSYGNTSRIESTVIKHSLDDMASLQNFRENFSNEEVMVERTNYYVDYSERKGYTYRFGDFSREMGVQTFEYEENFRNKTPEVGSLSDFNRLMLRRRATGGSSEFRIPNKLNVTDKEERASFLKYNIESVRLDNDSLLRDGIVEFDKANGDIREKYLEIESGYKPSRDEYVNASFNITYSRVDSTEIKIPEWIN